MTATDYIRVLSEMVAELKANLRTLDDRESVRIRQHEEFVRQVARKRMRLQAKLVEVERRIKSLPPAVVGSDGYERSVGQ